MDAHLVVHPSARFSLRSVLVCTARVFIPIAILGMILSAAGCVSQSQDQPAGTASLPLQSKAPVWGGDTQPASTDVVRVTITPQQAQEIAHACRDAPTELPASGDSTCEDEMQRVIRLQRGSCIRDLCSCNHSVCLEVGRTVAGQSMQPPVIVKIVDNQPGAPLCHSASGHLCFQLGAQAPVVQVLASGPPATPSPTGDPAPTTSVTPTTGTATPSPTEPASTSPTEPASTSPTEPASSTGPEPSGTQTPSSAGSGSE
jgi:hypothetical protein